MTATGGNIINVEFAQYVVNINVSGQQTHFLSNVIINDYLNNVVYGD